MLGTFTMVGRGRLRASRPGSPVHGRRHARRDAGQRCRLRPAAAVERPLAGAVVRAAALVLAVALAGCGDAPPPPAQNPLLFENLKPIALYDHIEQAETAMVGDAAKLKSTCREYLISKGMAAAVPALSSMFKASERIEASCEPYRAQLARRLSAHTDLSVSAAMLTDPLVWAKYANGRNDAVWRYKAPEDKGDTEGTPAGGSDTPPAVESKENGSFSSPICKPFC